MGTAKGNTVFGRYSREECGLPVADATGISLLKRTGRGLALLAAVILAGWLAGKMTSRWRAVQLENIVREVSRASNQLEKSETLARGKMLAVALRKDPEALLLLGEACMMASVNAPRQVGYYGNAASLLEGAGKRLAANPFLAFRAESAYAIALSETDKDVEALAALERANRALDSLPDNEMKAALKLNLVNQQSYILATSPVRRIRNPERALHLAQYMVSTRDRLLTGEFPSASPAFLDTLAAAWFAAGEVEKAQEAQTLALGLAKPGDLAIYIQHYDQYAKTSAVRAPRLMARAK